LEHARGSRGQVFILAGSRGQVFILAVFLLHSSNQRGQTFILRISSIQGE